MKKACLPILLIFLFIKISFAQQGKDGAKTITVNNTVVNEYTALTADASAGSTSITVSNNNLNTNGRFPGALSAGDLVMIIQMQGATINGTATDSTWGAVTNYNNCGLNEFEQVAGVSGTTTINLKCPLAYSFTASGNVQVIRVPRYTTLTIDAGDTLTCDAWEGAGIATGGIVAVEVSGNTVINTTGAINATGMGFRGGQLDNSGGNTGTISFVSNNVDDGAEKGESIAGYEAGYNVFGGMFCMGAPANGGGGGDGHNAGGGGGANGGDINSWTGNGNPDTTTDTAYREAWNLEYYGFANSTSSGGGRGGYTWCTTGNDPYTDPPGDPSWGGDNRRIVGGKGGRPLDYSTGRLFCGGGGGSGQEDNFVGGAGGNGGGIIYMLSYGTISGGGSVLSNGIKGQDAICVSGAGDPPGGGGAGGTIIINSSGTVSGISIFANGGAGGSQDITNTGSGGQPDESEGAGGGGGGGYIATSNGGLTTQLNGGINGTTNSVGVAPFLPNGGTAGGKGMDTSIAPVCALQLSAITGPAITCSGNSYTYSVAPSPCGNAVYTWTLPAGWSGTSATNSITATAGTTGGTIEVSASNGSCPLDTTIFVTVYPAPVNPNFPKDTTLCGTVNLTLNSGSTGFNYLWSTGDTTTSITVITPGIYWLQVSSNCDTLRDSIDVIHQTAPVVSLGNDTSYCSSFSRTLNAGNSNIGATYLWSTGDTSQSITVNTSGKYSVTVSNACGSVQSTITIIALDSPKVYLGKDTMVCNFANFILKADTGEGTYLWSTGASSQSITVPGPGTYWVTVSNACGRDSSAITITGCGAGYILPNAFTPGVSDINGLLYLLKTGSGNVTLNYYNIYNRWGQLIFSTSDDQTPWDGRFNGKPEQMDVYVYVVSYTDSFGRGKLLKGNITLLR